MFLHNLYSNSNILSLYFKTFSLKALSFSFRGFSFCISRDLLLGGRKILAPPYTPLRGDGTPTLSPCFLRLCVALCEKHDIWFTVAYIPGKRNIIADQKSRQKNIGTELRLNPQFLNPTLSYITFSPIIDLFASRINK